MYIKIITGFRKDQNYTIPINESHKAYYLFLNPEKRGIFSNGVALLGSQIQGIEPNYHKIMGWNETHVLDGDDWNEIRGKKIDIKIQGLLQKAKEIAGLMKDKPEVFSVPLDKVQIPQHGTAVVDEIKNLSDKLKI